MILKRQSYVLLIIILSIITSSTAQTQKVMKNEQMTPEQQNVLKAIQKMTNAFHNKDIAEVMASYEPNAQVIFEPKTPITDSTVLKEMFQQAFAINPRFSYSGHEVFVNDRIATHFAPWTMTGMAPDGTEIKQSGLSVAMLRKQDNGEWLIIFDNPHGNFLMN
ncbi:YybH family protein [Aquimarina sediminis]|uniref:YybH family protein n=1 Tax=Aquimarina sediminis TaxID=2070536 RepID=UPI0013E8EE6A|nr:nuclear transport factor 2 family protein [Aquimarina sediminis]